MTKKVDGFLADDGTFFEDEQECLRYDWSKDIEVSCESHGVDYENFMTLINAWHTKIEGYYNADKGCKERNTGNTRRISLDNEEQSFPHTEEDRADPPIRDKNAKGFLEQQIRRNK